MERCRLQEEIHNLKGNIRVFCRVRPQLPSEREAGGPAPSAGAGHALVRRPGADAADATFLPFEFPDALRKGAELTVVKPPAPGVDGVLRKAEPQKFSFDRCARCMDGASWEGHGICGAVEEWGGGGPACV
jgi:hypothetical protein